MLQKGAGGCLTEGGAWVVGHRLWGGRYLGRAEGRGWKGGVGSLVPVQRFEMSGPAGRE